MKVGDLVVLEYNGVDLEEKDRKKIGIVKEVWEGNGLAKVLWGNMDQSWNLFGHLEVIA